MMLMGTDAGWRLMARSVVTRVSAEVNCSVSISSRRSSMMRIGTSMEVTLGLNVRVMLLAIKSGSSARKDKI
jgi:predicted RNase H-like nuclease